jgi:CRP/FNR family transcriptional regulator, cyclic AMP receptor protein
MRKALQMLGILDDSDIEWLLSNGHSEHLSKGVVLIRKGVPIDNLYIVLEGKLLVQTDRAGEDVTIASLLTGEIVGEISFVDSRAPIATVVTSMDSRVLAVPSSAVRHKLERDTAFAARFYRALASFLADRLYTTTATLGYGEWDHPVDQLDTERLDEVWLAATRFEQVMKRLQVNAHVGSSAQSTAKPALTNY